MNKKISPIIAFFIIIIIAGIAGTAIFLFSREIREEIILLEKNIEPIADEQFINEPDKDLVFDMFDFMLFLPDGWSVEVNDLSENIMVGYGRFEFKLTPEGWENYFWGSFSIDINGRYKDIHEWIEYKLPNYKNDLIIERINDIGEKPTFMLNTEKGDKPWAPRYVILGEDYSYIYSFSQDGATGFTQRIIEEIFPNIIIKSVGEDKQVRDFLIKKDDMQLRPDKFEIIREDFNKDGVKEIFTIVSYCCPSATLLRILEKREDGKYDIKSERHAGGVVNSVEIASFPSGYKSVILSFSGKAGTGLSFRSKGVYIFDGEEIIKLWQGLVQYSERHISLTEEGSYNIENNYSIFFKDYDGDGEIDIIQEGEEKKEYINQETGDQEIEEKTVKNIYKWNEENKKYEKMNL